LKIENPTYIATEEILWLKEDGTEVSIQAAIGMPYKTHGGWSCPATLMGVDERYPDIAGASSFQSLNLAMRLIRQRLGHLLEDGAILVDVDDRNSRRNSNSLDIVFGRL